MTPLQALILGIVQGITEFFPVSSSAHLKLAKSFLGIPDGEALLYFDLVCHLGTLFALLGFLRKDVGAVLKDTRKWGLFALGLLPLIPAYFLLKPVRVALSDPAYLGYSLFVTAGLLLLASARKQPEWGVVGGEGPSLNSRSSKWRDVLCIGMMQACALIPGISRSGSTIAAGRLLGWTWMEAARFSFLLSIPAILGGHILETAKLLKGGPVEGDLSLYGIAFGASLIVGSVGVRCVFWIYKQGKVRPFAVYCLVIGCIAWAQFHGKTAS